jgi:hypothetical protein
MPVKTERNEAILQAYINGKRHTEIALEHGIAIQTVSDILKRHYGIANVPRPHTAKQIASSRQNNGRPTKSGLHVVRISHDAKQKLSRIAKAQKISISDTIDAIIKNFESRNS